MTHSNPSRSAVPSNTEPLWSRQAYETEFPPLPESTGEVNGSALGKIAPKRVAVSGGAVTGCFAAMIAHSKGFKVDLFEQRNEPTRQIQWSVRQAFLDSLARIDPVGAERLYQAIFDPTNDLASLLPRGSIKTISINGEFYLPTQKARPTPQKPDPSKDCSDFLEQKPCFIITARNLERFLHHRIEMLGGMRIVREAATIVDDPDNNRVLVNDQPYSFAICAEGSRSKTFHQMSIDNPHLERFVLSPERLQIAVVLKQSGLNPEQKTGGYISKHYDMRTQTEEPDYIKLTGVTAQEQSGRIYAWVVQDIENHFSRDLHLLLQEENGQRWRSWSNHESAVSRLEQYVIRHGIDQGVIEPIGKDPISITILSLKGLPVTDINDFILRHELVNDAAPSTRILFMGDSVGNAHWSVGGGMQIGAIAHGDRLSRYLDKTGADSSCEPAARAYSDGVIKDSQSWLVSGYADTCLDSGHYLEDHKADPEHTVGKIKSEYDRFIPKNMRDKETHRLTDFEAARKLSLEKIEGSFEESLVPVTKEVYVATLRSWLRDLPDTQINLAEMVKEIPFFRNSDDRVYGVLESLVKWIDKGADTVEGYERYLLAEVYITQLRENDGWPKVHVNRSQLSSLPDNMIYSKLEIKDCQKLSTLGHNIRFEYDKSSEDTINTELSISHCNQLVSIPGNLTLTRLNISECPMVNTLGGNIHTKVLEVNSTDPKLCLPKDIYVEELTGDDLLYSSAINEKFTICTSLTRLTSTFSTFMPETLSHLKNLQYFDSDWCSFENPMEDGQTLYPYDLQPSLTYLSIPLRDIERRQEILDAFVWLKRFPNLEALRLAGAEGNIRNSDLVQLGKLGRLMLLDLQDCNISLTGIKQHLGHLEGLQVHFGTENRYLEVYTVGTGHIVSDRPNWPRCLQLFRDLLTTPAQSSVYPDQTDSPANTDQIKPFVTIIKRLFAIESAIEKHHILGMDQVRFRQKHSKPLVEQFFSQVDDELNRADLHYGTPFFTALSYAYNGGDELRAFLNDCGIVVNRIMCTEAPNPSGFSEYFRRDYPSRYPQNDQPESEEVQTGSRFRYRPPWERGLGGIEPSYF